MGKRIDPRERITQKSVGFHFRQMEFFNDYPEFRPDEFCRKIIDNQIRIINPEFLSKSEREEKE